MRVPLDRADAAPVKQVQIATIDDWGAVPDIRSIRWILRLAELLGLTIVDQKSRMSLPEDVDFLARADARAGGGAIRKRNILDLPGARIIAMDDMVDRAEIGTV